MASPVKRPTVAIDAKLTALFDKLDDVALKHDKTQFAEALKALENLKLEAKALKDAGVVTRDFDRELKRQENRHKMDEMDSNLLKKMNEEKKEGLDQVSVAKAEPADAAPRPPPVADESGCTIGDPGKFLFVAGMVAAVVYFGV